MPVSRIQAPSEVASGVATVAVRGTWLKHTYPGSPALPEREPAQDNRW